MDYTLQTFSWIFEKEVPFSFTPDQEKVVHHVRSVFFGAYPDRDGKKSISSLPMFYTPKGTMTNSHDLITLAKESQYRGYGKHQHEVFQQHAMKNSFAIVACEVPVWTETIHGFIDMVYFYGDKILIADFKPGAKGEKKAPCQLIHYGSTLATLCDLDPASIELCYHDDLHCISFSLPYGQSN
jgi:hypothetical protein